MKIRKTKAVRRGLRTVLRICPRDVIERLPTQQRHEAQRALDWIYEQARGIDEEENKDAENGV